jgi:hypothetical protein
MQEGLLVEIGETKRSLRNRNESLQIDPNANELHFVLLPIFTINETLDVDVDEKEKILTEVSPLSGLDRATSNQSSKNTIGAARFSRKGLHQHTLQVMGQRGPWQMDCNNVQKEYESPFEIRTSQTCPVIEIRTRQVSRELPMNCLCSCGNQLFTNRDQAKHTETIGITILATDASFPQPVLVYNNKD